MIESKHLEGIFKLEAEIESNLKAFKILQANINAPIVGLFYLIDAVESGGRFNAKEGSANTALDLAGRLSCLENHLLYSEKTFGGKHYFLAGILTDPKYQNKLWHLYFS